MSEHDTLMVRVLVFRDGTSYVAQCLEFDIAAQGKTIEEASLAFERTIIGQIMLDLRRGKKPLEGIGRAPLDYEEKFEQAMRVEDEEQITLPKDITPAFMVHEIRKEQRVIQWGILLPYRQTPTYKELRLILVRNYGCEFKQDDEIIDEQNNSYSVTYFERKTDEENITCVVVFPEDENELVEFSLLRSICERFRLTVTNFRHYLNNLPDDN